MAITLELMKADLTDAQMDRFSENALKAVAKKYKDNPDALNFVTRGFSPNPKAIPSISNLIYSCGALLVTLEEEAEEIVMQEGLVTASGGYMALVKADAEGVRHYDSFNLDRVALVKPKDKVG